jgi:shikimate dehydrogenase
MREACVIGRPVAHSRSPAIFAWLCERLGVADLDYRAREVAPEQLAAFVAAARANPAFVGMNVTIPHKEAVGALLDELAPEALAVGAVNAVVARDGRLRGHNTDALAVRSTLEAAGVDPAHALVWGAGGAARAVLHALGEMGARDVAILNRDAARAAALADRFAPLFPATRFAVGPPTAALTLAVNATPVGMHGVEAPDGFFDALPPGAGWAFDLVYNPERTPFLARAADRGYALVFGLGMLVDQALATWGLWFGDVPPLRRDLEMAIRRTLGTAPIFLCGFMGSGKTTAGRALAGRLGRVFVDTDALVEAEAGTRIRDLFAARGEAAFRALEKRAIERAALTPGAVVSLGGGALLDPDNVALVRSAGPLVHLAATPATIERRLAAADDRPLLGSAPLAELLARRAPGYARADVRIDTDDLDPAHVAEAVARAVTPCPAP